MKLRREFETIKSNLISRESVQLLDSFVGELLKEEQRLNIQVVLEQKVQNSTRISFPKLLKGDMTNVQCYSCIEFGHIATNSTKYFCNYSKKTRHIIKYFSIQHPKKPETIYNLSISPLSNSNPGQSTITSKMVQQMIVFAFSCVRSFI